MIMANDKSSAMTDLEDLNRTLYDIGAQDLLDVWEAMESVSDFYIGFSYKCHFRLELHLSERSEDKCGQASLGQLINCTD